MKFCDMHNDAVTSKKDWGKYAEINDKKGNITVYALFYDGKNEKEIYAALPRLKNRFYSFENIGYKNPDDIKNLVQTSRYMPRSRGTTKIILLSVAIIMTKTLKKKD